MLLYQGFGIVDESKLTSRSAEIDVGVRLGVGVGFLVGFGVGVGFLVGFGVGGGVTSGVVEMLSGGIVGASLGGTDAAASEDSGSLGITTDGGRLALGSGVTSVLSDSVAIGDTLVQAEMATAMTASEANLTTRTTFSFGREWS